MPPGALLPPLLLLLLLQGPFARSVGSEEGKEGLCDDPQMNGAPECQAVYERQFEAVLNARIKGNVEKKENPEENPLMVDIWNFREDTLDVYWINFEGNPVDVGHVGPFETYSTETFKEHTFKFVKSTGKEVVGKLTMYPECTTYIIHPESHGAEKHPTYQKILREAENTSCKGSSDPKNKWKYELWFDPPETS